MRLSEHAKSTVRPRDAWIALAATAVLLCLIGVYVQETKNTHGISPWLCGGALLFLWGIALFHLVRFGRQAFPRQRVTALIGSTLFLGSQLWPQPPTAISWARNVGCLMLVMGSLSPFVAFGKQKATR